VTDWPRLQHQGRYRDVAELLIDQLFDWDLDALRLDAYGTIDRSQEIALVLQDGLTSGCGGGGYYRANPPTIYLHPAIRRRNNFTVLHELGHHVQQHHSDWAFVLLDLSVHARRLAEESVSNEFAAHLLIPWSDDPLESRDIHPADMMMGLFHDSTASRSAVLHRVAGLLPKEAKWILAVADSDGIVQFALSTYADAQPAKGNRGASEPIHGWLH
jgi:Zn-dependent peptidase ImmA (M78 family)